MLKVENADLVIRYQEGRHMSTGTTSEQQTFADALDPETLSALMRSTWTWDDRALRRDLR